MELKDSGNRREFTTGAVRDIAEGKGRCDLLPLDIIGNMMVNPILIDIERYTRTGEESYLESAISEFAQQRFDNLETAILEVSKHYEDGANKYAERNWEKGIPLHCYIDSGVRHYLKVLRGDKDEPHDRAFIWNMLGALWTAKNKPELVDLPFADCSHRQYFGDYSLHYCDIDSAICDTPTQCTKKEDINESISNSSNP